MASLPSIYKTLTKVPRKYTKVDIKIFWSCQILLDVFTLLQIFLQDYLEKIILAYRSSQPPPKLNCLVVSITSKSFSNL